MKQFDLHLVVDDHRVICRNCEEDICTTDENYKLHTLCNRKPLSEAGPLVNDPEQYVDNNMEFREFYCPGCGTLLENEVIKADHKPIHDKQLFQD